MASKPQKRSEYPLYLWVPVHPKSYEGAPKCSDCEVSIDEPRELDNLCSNGGRYFLYKRAI